MNNFIQKISEKIYRLRKRTSFLGQKILIVILLIVLLILIFTQIKDISILDRSRSVSPIDTNPLREYPVQNIAWDIVIPDGYSILEKGTFEDQYFSIYHEQWSDLYVLEVYEGQEYSMRSIKEFLDGKILSFKDFEDIDSLSRVQYIDNRGMPRPSLEIPEEPTD